MNPDFWTNLIDDIVVAIKECIAKNQNPAGQLENPGPAARFKVARIARKASGMGPLEWRRNKQAVMADVWAQHSFMDEYDRAELMALAQED